jgi:hypothetical protein
MEREVSYRWNLVKEIRFQLKIKMEVMPHLAINELPRLDSRGRHDIVLNLWYMPVYMGMGYCGIYILNLYHSYR